jgi:hypothetical protein
VDPSLPFEEWPLDSLAAKLKQYCFMLEDMDGDVLRKVGGLVGQNVLKVGGCCWRQRWHLLRKMGGSWMLCKAGNGHQACASTTPLDVDLLSAVDKKYPCLTPEFLQLPDFKESALPRCQPLPWHSHAPPLFTLSHPAGVRRRL